MSKVSYAIIGGGWRSEFFARVAKEMPEVFDCQGVWMRNPEKAVIYQEKMGMTTFSDLDELLKLEVDFFVLIMPWTVNYEYAKQLIARGKSILIETPAAPDVESLNELWEISNNTKVTIGVAEEYHFQPYHASAISLVEQGVVGDPSYLHMSMMHGYHFSNVARRLLGIKMENFSVVGESFQRNIIKTCTRVGEAVGESPVLYPHDISRVQFENGKTWMYDFSGEQYFSLLRSTSMCLQAERGEIRGNEVRYINEDGECVCEELRRIDLGKYANLQEYTHKGFTFEGKWIYKNPLIGGKLTDDEIAVGCELLDMKCYIETGTCQYPLKEALQDAYISFLMKEARDTGKVVCSERQSWHEE